MREAIVIILSLGGLELLLFLWHRAEEMADRKLQRRQITLLTEIRDMQPKKRKRTQKGQQ